MYHHLKEDERVCFCLLRPWPATCSTSLVFERGKYECMSKRGGTWWKPKYANLNKLMARAACVSSGVLSWLGLSIDPGAFLSLAGLAPRLASLGSFFLTYVKPSNRANEPRIDQIKCQTSLRLYGTWNTFATPSTIALRQCTYISGGQEVLNIWRNK